MYTNLINTRLNFILTSRYIDPKTPRPQLGPLSFSLKTKKWPAAKALYLQLFCNQAPNANIPVLSRKNKRAFFTHYALALTCPPLNLINFAKRLRKQLLFKKDSRHIKWAKMSERGQFQLCLTRCKFFQTTEELADVINLSRIRFMLTFRGSIQYNILGQDLFCLDLYNHYFRKIHD